MELRKSFTVSHPNGINVDQCAQLTEVVREYKNTECVMAYNSRYADIKSFLNVTSLGLKHKDIFTIICKGVSSNEALLNIEQTLQSLKIVN
ncbi:HPr family phosphocarrier protein [Mycoplasma corogypsi]|uniref:HPr family phosphocarrier protein n=1 Tax=Mycoplasma corogypsi TaxID=2106 RepID=UPI003873B213